MANDKLSYSLNPVYNYRAISTNWDLQIAIPGNLGILSDVVNGGNKLAVNCQSVSLPNTNVSTVEGNVRGVRFHQIQTRASTQLQTNLTFYEPHDYSIYRFFETWKAQTVSRYDASQNPDVKIKDGVSIRLYAVDRSEVVLEYVLYDTYCASAQISDPNNSGSLQTVTTVLMSSNYGIKAYAKGLKVFANCAEDGGYLEGNKWVKTKV